MSGGAAWLVLLVPLFFVLRAARSGMHELFRVDRRPDVADAVRESPERSFACESQEESPAVEEPLYPSVLARYGLPARTEDRDELRALLEAEASLAEDWKEREEMLRLLCVQLASVGVVEDVFLIWRAKRSNFDAGVGLDGRFLMGAGLEPTRAFLRASDDPSAPEILEYLEGIEDDWESEQLLPSTVVRDFQAYFGVRSDPVDGTEVLPSAAVVNPVHGP